MRVASLLLIVLCTTADHFALWIILIFVVRSYEICLLYDVLVFENETLVDF